MSYYRLFGILMLILGMTGFLLSVSSDFIGLSLTGGTKGWGIINAIGTLGGFVLMLIGTAITIRFTKEPTEREVVKTPVYNKESVFVASTIPTIAPPSGLREPKPPLQTVVTPDVSSFNPQISKPVIGNQTPINFQPTPQLHGQQSTSVNDDNDYAYECPTCGSNLKEEDLICEICGEEFE